MKAIILAAGRGTRLRPITDTIPKPLVEVKGRALIEYHLESLAMSGIREVVINVSHLAEKIKAVVGDGQRFGIMVHYSYEHQPLETGGGIFNALPLLGDGPFLAINGDIWTNYPFKMLLDKPLQELAHLVLVQKDSSGVKNRGDFSLDKDYVVSDSNRDLTYTGIAVYSPKLFGSCKSGTFSVVPLLERAIAERKVTGEIYTGSWQDIGTIMRLEALNRTFFKNSMRV